MPEAEIVFEIQPGIAEKSVNLQRADLVADRLSRVESKKYSFLSRRFKIHRHSPGQVGAGLLDRKITSRQANIDLDPQRPQTHKAVYDFPGCRAVVEQPRLQQHFLDIKPDAFIGAGIDVSPAHRVRILP